MEKVSVIVPVYNSEKYLAECISSVIEQTYKNWELLLIDDCSTDKSLDIIKSYADKDMRIRLITNETNSGPAFSRNRGIENATGDLICFLDSDDYYLPDFLTGMVSAYKNNDVDFVISFFYNKKGSELLGCKLNFDILQSTPPPLTETFSRHTIPGYLFNVVSYPIWNRIYSRKFLLENNLRFEDVRYGEDGYFNRLTTFCAENIVLVPEYLIVHRTHSANLSSTFNADNCNMTERIMVQREELIRRGASEKILQSLTNLWLTDAYYHKYHYPYMKEKKNYVKVYSALKKHLKFYPKGYIYDAKVARFVIKLKLLPPSLLFELERLRAEILRLKDKIFSILGW